MRRSDFLQTPCKSPVTKLAMPSVLQKYAVQKQKKRRNLRNKTYCIYYSTVVFKMQRVFARKSLLLRKNIAQTQPFHVKHAHCASPDKKAHPHYHSIPFHVKHTGSSSAKKRRASPSLPFHVKRRYPCAIISISLNAAQVSRETKHKLRQPPPKSTEKSKNHPFHVKRIQPGIKQPREAVFSGQSLLFCYTGFFIMVAYALG